MKFIGSKDSYSSADIVLFGMPFDSTSSFRAGSRFGPDNIRLVSDVIETYSPYQDKDLEEISFIDAGNLDLPPGSVEKSLDQVFDFAGKLISNNKLPFGLGGEHVLTYAVVKAIRKKYKDLVLLQLDAHADLREDYLGLKLSHASVMNLCLELKKVDLIQVGIRSGTREEFQFMKKNKTLHAVNNLDLINSKLKGRNVYLSVDIDVFDPSIVPGTGTPEAGGITFNQFMELLMGIRDFNLAGLDLVELNPEYDSSHNSSIFACKIIREMLLRAGMLIGK